MQKLIVATKNKKKLAEIKTLLKGLNLKIISLLDFPNPPRIKETGKTFRDNAIKKALIVARHSGLLTLGEDSGIEVDALEGKPGVYSSRFSGGKKDDSRNNQKLLRLLKDLPPKQRKAHYRCSVALADRHGLLVTKQGSCSGSIGYQPKGKSGFGYDPIFIVPGFGKTFAQLGQRLKHKMSHRSRALKKIEVPILRYFKQVK